MSSDPAVVGGSRSLRAPRLSRVVPAAVGAIVLADVVAAFVDLGAGLALQALVLLALLNLFLLATRTTEEGPEAQAALALVALALVPVVRITTSTVTVDTSSPLAYAAPGIPLLLAALLAARYVGLERLTGLARIDRRQVWISLIGAPASILVYVAARPAPPDTAHIGITVALATLVLLVYPALTEELIFRGVLQHSLADVLGRTGILLSVLLYATGYLGVQPVGYAVVAAVLGGCFAALVARTGSLVGVVGAHALVAVGALLVWPIVLG